MRSRETSLLDRANKSYKCKTNTKCLFTRLWDSSMPAEDSRVKQVPAIMPGPHI